MPTPFTLAPKPGRAGAGAAALAAAGLLLTAAMAAAEPAPLTLAPNKNGTDRRPAVETEVSFPGQQVLYLFGPTNSWVDSAALEFDVILPTNAPPDIQALVHVMDWDYFWYQKLLDGALRPGQTNRLRVDLSPQATGWQAVDHQGVWHLRALMEPKEVGLHLFGETAFTGRVRVAQACAVPPPRDSAPPVISNVRVNTGRPACHEKFEITFDLPDRYPNPFDPDRVVVTAEVRTPDGRRVRVDGFHAQDYFRSVEPTGERFFAQGRPFWRVRFAPSRPGLHTYTLHVRDERGQTQWGPGTFEATPPRRPGFVRVAKSDPRYFEFDDGTPYFPLGHNVRSPFDSRMDDQFPWIQRWIDGTAAYDRYFEAMHKHGENLTEVWSAAWSLGLEWTPRWRGYHGLGQYNLMHAWEMDRVVEKAEELGIYINLVVHNHGKFSLYWDSEWPFNPYNEAAGGYLADPEQYFTNARARADFLRMMRYMVARWGYSTSLMAWELFNEFDLAGNRKEFGGADQHFHHRPEAVDWLRAMGRAVKDLDPYDHLVSSHVCDDYRRQNPEICKLPEMDLCAVDAYHGSPDPLHIVTLLQETAQFNNAFNKPVLVTEFGGSPFGHGVKHLRDGLHAALWASVCVPMGGAPMFWWWQLIEEEDLYPEYLAVSRFMAGEDHRDPRMVARPATLQTAGGSAARVRLLCLAGRRKGLGWICNPLAFDRVRTATEEVFEDTELVIPGLDSGIASLEFWDTGTGVVAHRNKVAIQEGTLRCAVPDFNRDLAFKFRIE